jgi:hypothetical protein
MLRDGYLCCSSVIDQLNFPLACHGLVKQSIPEYYGSKQAEVFFPLSAPASRRDGLGTAL